MLPQEDFVVRTIVRPQSGACAFESVTRQDPTPFVDRKTEQELFRAQDKSFRPTFTSKPWVRTVTATEAVSLQVHSRLYPGPFLYSITARVCQGTFVSLRLGGVMPALMLPS